MTANLTIPEDKKLTIIYRVEGGCLGPTGDELVSEFCQTTQSKLQFSAADYVNCILSPRLDNSQLETEYQIMTKRLSREKAEKYLALLAIKIDDLESQLLDSITDHIERYLNR